MNDSFYDPDVSPGEWTTLEYREYRVPAPDWDTRQKADQALAVLTPNERAVIELAYGFRGHPKTDDEVAVVLGSTHGTVKKQRQRAMRKMRLELAGEPDEALAEPTHALY